MLLNLESGAGRWGERAQGDRAQGNGENLLTKSNRRLTDGSNSQISNLKSADAAAPNNS